MQSEDLASGLRELFKVHIDREPWPLAMVILSDSVVSEGHWLEVFVVGSSGDQLEVNQRYQISGDPSPERLRLIAQVACQRALLEKYPASGLPAFEPASEDWLAAARSFGMYPAAASIGSMSIMNDANDFVRRLKGNWVTTRT